MIIFKVLFAITSKSLFFNLNTITTNESIFSPVVVSNLPQIFGFVSLLVFFIIFYKKLSYLCCRDSGWLPGQLAYHRLQSPTLLPN